MDAEAVSVTVLCGLAVLAAVVAFVLADAPVTPWRVEVFAARQGLSVTKDNCTQVIAYLAVTRRWRSAGLAAALTWYVVVALRHQSIGVNIVYALSGWFAGALIAEVRVASPATTPTAASLERRTPERYLAPVNRWLLPASAASCLTLAAVAAATGSVGPGRTVAVWTAAGIGLPVLVALVAHRILLRPQPRAAPDVWSADEAIRRRSLQVVTASAITLLLYCVLDQLQALLDRTDASAVTVAMLMLVGAVAVPLTGWQLAGGKVRA